ncbi:MAG: hypothetical protein AAF253_08865 [Pseudomonadota bacterium]
MDQLKYIRDEIEAWLWNDDRFAKPPETALFVRVDNFNSSSIDFLIYTFTHTKNWGGSGWRPRKSLRWPAWTSSNAPAQVSPSRAARCTCSNRTRRKSSPHPPAAKRPCVPSPRKQRWSAPRASARRTTTVRALGAARAARRRRARCVSWHRPSGRLAGPSVAKEAS